MGKISRLCAVCVVWLLMIMCLPAVASAPTPPRHVDKKLSDGPDPIDNRGMASDVDKPDAKLVDELEAARQLNEHLLAVVHEVLSKQLGLVVPHTIVDDGAPFNKWGIDGSGGQGVTSFILDGADPTARLPIHPLDVPASACSNADECRDAGDVVCRRLYGEHQSGPVTLTEDTNGDGWCYTQCSGGGSHMVSRKCKRGVLQPYCGDTVCDPGEDHISCTADCHE